MMRTKNLLLGSLLLAFTLFSCEPNDETKTNAESGVVVTSQNKSVIDEIIKQGYRLEDIVETPEFYLVQGDIMFSKNIEDYSHSDPEERHAYTNNLLSSSFTVVTVAIDPSINTAGVDNWTSALNAAMTEWSNVPGTSIRFVLYSGSNPDILVKSDNNVLGNNVIASAGFPANGKAYNQILINLDFNSNMTVSESTKKYNLVHELGHCIGFRHTNWELLGESAGGIGANYIPNTPTQDSNSVMNGGTALYSWNGFSSYDSYAVKYLYPGFACNLRLEGPHESCAFDVDNNPIQYNVYLVSTGSAVTNGWSISGNSLEIVATYARYCKVRVKSNNTTWPATGVVTMETSDCTVTYPVSLGNCINYDYQD